MGGAASIPKSSTMKTEGSLYLCTVTLDRIADSFLPRKPRKLRHVLFSMAWADPCFDRRRPCVLCLWSESKIWGHPGSRYVYIYIWYIYRSHAVCARNQNQMFPRRCLRPCRLVALDERPSLAWPPSLGVQETPSSPAVRYQGTWKSEVRGVKRVHASSPRFIYIYISQRRRTGILTDQASGLRVNV